MVQQEFPNMCNTFCTDAAEPAYRFILLLLSMLCKHVVPDILMVCISKLCMRACMNATVIVIGSQ